MSEQQAFLIWNEADRIELSLKSENRGEGRGLLHNAKF